MAAAYWDRLQEVFHAASGLTGRDREAYLNTTCGNDAEFRRELEKLLAAYESDGGDDLHDVISGTAVEMFPQGPLEGDRVGPYRLISQISQGGMGAVYRAVRADGEYDLEVAIKVVRPDLAGPGLLKRFRRERQILASLTHPHIARLLDGGISADGSPYLVMEYIAGVTIDQYCRQRSIPERVRLFQQVCQAVQYAHQNLLIHRDIKPSNVMVTPDHQPKLLDFGIAKLLTPDAGQAQSQTGLTRPADRLMTLEYASPEQIRGQRVNTATDVYSLGTLLYELLTGTQPFGVAKLDLLEAQRRICEDELPRPSSRHSAVGKELDDIVAKATRKDLTQRYSSAQELSDDLGRFLAGFPVQASSGAWSYRAQKYVRRHRFILLAAGILLALMAGWIITLRNEQAHTRQRFNEVREMSEMLLLKVDSAILPLPGSTPARRMLVGEGLKYLKSLAVDARSDDSLAEALADAYGQISSIQYRTGTANVGDPEGGAASLRLQQSLLEPLAAKRPRDWRIRAKLLACYGQMVDTLGTLKGKQGETVAAYQSLLRVISEIDPRAVEDPVVRTQFSIASMRLGTWELNHNNAKAAVDHFRRAALLRERDLAASPRDPELGIALAWAHDWLCMALAGHDYALGDRAGALEQSRIAIDLLSRIIQESPVNQVAKSALAVVYQHRANVYLMLKRYDDALADIRQNVALSEEHYRVDPDNYSAVRDLSTAYGNLGKSYGGLGRGPEALAAYEKQYNLRRKFVVDHPADVSARVALAICEANFAESLLQFHQPAQSLTHAAAGEVLWRDLANETKRPLYFVYQATTLHVLAGAQEAQNQWRDARATLQKAERILSAPEVKTTMPGSAKDLPAQVQKELALCEAHLGKG